jgi:hypothetical protein
MKISTIDKNMWYTMDIEKCEWSSDHIAVISFELNNLSDYTKYPIPDETGFIMSIEDAKQLHAWLGVVLNGS